MSMTEEVNVSPAGGVESVGGMSENEGKPDVVTSLPPGDEAPVEVASDEGVKEKEEGGVVVSKGRQEESDSDSEDDLQLIVNDEDIYYPHGTEGAQEGEGEEMFAVGGEEPFEDMDWAAEMHSYHSQFFKYVRPGTGAGGGEASADGSGPFTPGSMGNYPVGMWPYSFETAYEFILPPSQTIFDIDVEQFEDKPWDYPGVDITDYFNFGFTEESWKQYCEEFARIKETSATRMHEYDDGQGWNDNGEPESVRGRGHRRNMRSIQVEGGENERRDMRRQRLRDMQDGRLHEYQGDRRRQRNDDAQRRKGYSRQGHSEQASPLGGRLGRTGSLTQTSPGRTFSSPSRDRRLNLYTPRTRLPSPGSAQNAVNGFRRHSMDGSNRPWQRSSRRHEFDDESHGSTDSDRRESEDEMSNPRNHRLRRFSSQPLEKRLGARAEPPPNEVKSVPEKRVVKRSRYAMQEDEKKPVMPELPKRLPPKVERSPASAEAVEKREPVTERRIIHTTTRRVNQATEGRSAPASEKRSTDVAKFETIAERKAEPAPERRMQSISERRAQLIAVRKAEQAEKREKFLREQASEMKLETERTKAPVKVEKIVSDEKMISKDKSGESQEEMKLSRSVSVMKLEDRADPVKDQDLRMQVIERVCSRWKFHIRRGDTRAKKRKQSMDSEGNEDAGGKSQSPRGSYREKVEDEETEVRTRDERKRTYREKPRQYDDDEDAGDYDHPNERWQMDDARERRLDARDDGSMSARRSSLRHSGTKRRYNDENGVVETWAVDEDVGEDNGRWNGDQTRRKRRKFNYNIVEEEHFSDEVDDGYNYDSRGRGSTSSGHADEVYYRRTGKSYSRKSDRWTGSLYDSGGEYDER